MKNTLLLFALLLPSYFGIQSAYAKDYKESAEECFKLMEKFVNGGHVNEKKDWFFHFQDHRTMKYADFDSSTHPATQYWNFDPKTRPRKEQVTMQVFEDPDLESQASVPDKDKIVRRYVITHTICKEDVPGKGQKTGQKDIQKCVPDTFKKTIFDIQNPSSKNCFKRIQSASQSSEKPETIYSSSFCQQWNSFSAKNKSDSKKELYEKFRRENPDWKNEFNEFVHPDSTGLLSRVVSNCKTWVASDDAAWDASKVPAYQAPSAPTGTGGK